MPSAAEPVLEFQQVTKKFGALTVLENFNFSLDAGEKVALIGPSGSGKSTVLRIAMTLENIQAGSVRVHGEYLWRDAEAVDRAQTRRVRAHLGMVFQHFHLFPHLSVLDNLTPRPRSMALHCSAALDCKTRRMHGRTSCREDRSSAWRLRVRSPCSRM
jgi:polar amino acid transport system ATP-binding protein